MFDRTGSCLEALVLETAVDIDHEQDEEYHDDGIQDDVHSSSHMGPSFHLFYGLIISLV